MRFGLCMIVKNEEEALGACLDAVLPACAEAVVVDTGSTDGTRDVLARYGITPLALPMDPALCNSKAPARNLAFERIAAPWILCLDADERISAEGLTRLTALPEQGPGGYFLAWNTYRGDDVVADYKLALFRKGPRATGCSHETVQYSIRELGIETAWLDGVEIVHHPDPRKDALKYRFYGERLDCGITRDPNWYRYYWFMGYRCYRDGDFEGARRQFEIAFGSRSQVFPVECLNSGMLLAELDARGGDATALAHTLAVLQEVFDERAGDFEVRVNFRLGPWITRAQMLATEGRLDEIRAYPFPY